METNEITAQILSAWDEVSEPEPEGDEPETDEPTTPEEETGEEQEDGAAVEPPAEEEVADEETETPGDEPETDDEEEADGEEDEEPEVVATFETDDPSIQAFLRKFNGDVGKALRYGLESQQAFSRQGAEKQALEKRVVELQAQLTQAETFSGNDTFLSPEQKQWAGEALESGNPIAFVRAAVEAGEFGLARAICTEWGNEAPYEALRAANAVDVAEAAIVNQPVELPPVDHAALLDALVPHFPDLPSYAEQMTATIGQLGPTHPLVEDSRSSDPETAMRGVIGIYEIARASTHALASTRENVKNGNRVEADEKRKKAVVSSAGATPSPSESVRPVKLGPGLTLEALEEEWERSK